MERRSINLFLPNDLLQKAKAVAALQETSLSEILRKTLEEQGAWEDHHVAARRRQTISLKKGFRSFLLAAVWN